MPKGGVTLLFHFSHLLHYNVDVQWDRIRGINIYIPDPADLGSRPWHRVPTSATQTVAMWELPLPTDMASSSDPLVSRSVFVRSLMERSRGDIRQWSWVWEREIEKVMFVSSQTMEESFSRKESEIGHEFQVVFHGTPERSNVDSILSEGFDRGKVKRARRGVSPAWCSSSFDEAFSFSQKPGAVLMNRLLLGTTWLDNSRRSIRAPKDTKLCTEDSNFPNGDSPLPPPHYLQMGPREADQVCTFAVFYFRTGEDTEELVNQGCRICGSVAARHFFF